jgi:hypothetical protein
MYSHPCAKNAQGCGTRQDTPQPTSGSTTPSPRPCRICHTTQLRNLRRIPPRNQDRIGQLNGSDHRTDRTPIRVGIGQGNTSGSAAKRKIHLGLSRSGTHASAGQETGNASGRYSDFRSGYAGSRPTAMDIGAIGGRTGLSVFDLVQTKEQLRYRNRKETGWLLFQAELR